MKVKTLTNKEKDEALKTALNAIGPIETDDGVEMALLKAICHALTAYRMYIMKGGKNA